LLDTRVRDERPRRDRGVPLIAPVTTGAAAPRAAPFSPAARGTERPAPRPRWQPTYSAEAARAPGPGVAPWGSERCPDA